MKFKLPLFSASLIIGLALVSLLAWSWSLQQVVQQENRIQSAALEQLWQSQIVHLKQKQRLWLQSQYHLISNLLDSSDQDQRLQAFLWGYYQRNPSIHSVLLIKFDQNGEIKKSNPQNQVAYNFSKAIDRILKIIRYRVLRAVAWQIRSYWKL